LHNINVDKDSDNPAIDNITLQQNLRSKSSKISPMELGVFI